MLTFIISTLNLFISKELVKNNLTSTFFSRKQTAYILKQALCVEKKKMFVISIINAFYIILVNIGVEIISCLSFPQILISN